MAAVVRPAASAGSRGPWLAEGSPRLRSRPCARSLPVPLDASSSLGGTLLSRIPDMNQEYPRRSAETPRIAPGPRLPAQQNDGGE